MIGNVVVKYVLWPKYENLIALRVQFIVQMFHLILDQFISRNGTFHFPEDFLLGTFPDWSKITLNSLDN